MIKLKTLLKEYITNPIIYLKDYLESDEDAKIKEVSFESYGIHEWLMYHYSEIAKKYNDHEEYEIPEMLQSDHPDILYEWGKHVLEHIDDFSQDRPGFPSWNHMDYANLIKNQWLIHFSDNAAKIVNDKKFKYLMGDYTQLGLTTMYKQDSFDKTDNGYGFAYALSDFVKYSSNRNGFKYGNEAVLFTASGIRVHHYGDEEPQVIFYGPTANNFVYLENTDGDWVVGDNIYQGDLENVVKWVVKNYKQYKNKI